MFRAKSQPFLRAGDELMPKTLNVGMIGYKFMGRAHSNAWLKADKFFDLKARPILKVICGREKAGVMNACTRWGGTNS